MARETKTIQCYPDDKIVNDRIRQYESFGWELINNQRCQEYEGQTYSGDTTVNHYSTFNKLTFTREKNTAWYKEVTALEEKYNKLLDDKPVRPAENKAKLRFFFGVVFMILSLPLLSIGIANGSVIMIGVGVVPIVIGLIIMITGIVKNKRNKQAQETYRTIKDAWELTSGREAEKIMEQARDIVENA